MQTHWNIKQRNSRGRSLCLTKWHNPKAQLQHNQSMGRKWHDQADSLDAGIWQWIYLTQHVHSTQENKEKNHIL